MEKILLGLSGGVDSAVAGAQLQKIGYEVIGCYLLLSENSSEESEDAENAKKVAETLGIKLAVRDFRERFREKVSDYFINEYLSGKTPNPCIICNPEVKIKSLIDTADELGIEKVATGHYALTSYSEKYASAVLTAAPSKKDQSYFLCRLSNEQIERIVFPLGNFDGKDEVREKAQSLSLPNAKKADSQEICFIPDNNYQKYIIEHSSFIPEAGNFLDNDGNIIGKHTGIINYTVGQRKGLGAFGEPRYVKNINARDNTVTLCKKDERFAKSLLAEDISWTVKEPPKGSFHAKVKIRSTAVAEDAVISVTDGIMTVEFNNSVLAPTPGQTAAIYDGNIVIGAAKIKSHGKI